MVPIYHGTGESSDGVSKLNRAEATAVVQAVDRICQKLPACDVGVVTPYLGQVARVEAGH